MFPLLDLIFQITMQLGNLVEDAMIPQVVLIFVIDIGITFLLFGFEPSKCLYTRLNGDWIRWALNLIAVETCSASPFSAS